MKDILFFSKVKENAIIPSKIDENGWYDIYACFDEKNLTIIQGEIKLIPTGIASACDPKYRIGLYERGSTGSIGLSLKCGRIDAGFRGEWFVAINNTTNKPITISKGIGKVIHNSEEIIYPYSKAICQAALESVPDVDVKEIPYEELMKIQSERGINCLGSSGK